MNTSSAAQNNAGLLNRRQWLATGLSSLAGLAGMHTTHTQAAAEEPVQASLKFSSWLKPVRGDLKQQLDFVERSGFEAVELRGTIANNKQSWLKALKDDKRAIFKAATLAQAAADLVLVNAGLDAAPEPAQEAPEAQEAAPALPVVHPPEPIPARAQQAAQQLSMFA